MKKKPLIIFISLVVLLIVGISVAIIINNTQSDPSGNDKPGEVQELKVDFFGEFEPFECNGDYTSYSYISEVTNQAGTRFYSVSSSENNKHNDTLVYLLKSGEEKTLFSMNIPDIDIEVMSYIDNALYFNISNADESGVNGLYRMWLDYDETGEVHDSRISLRFDMNLEPMRASDNTLLLRSGEQYYIFDTQTGECAAYN